MNISMGYRDDRHRLSSKVSNHIVCQIVMKEFSDDWQN